MTVSEQRAADQAGKKSDATETTDESSAAEAVGPSSEDISRLLVQIQDFLAELLPRREVTGEELTAEDLESYAKVRDFLSGRRQGSGVGALIENLEDALSVIAEARDGIDSYLDVIDLEPERGRPARRPRTRR